MNNNENSIWFSQTTLSYKDNQFDSDGYLRVGLSTSTNDYKYYNQPTFNFSISNQYSKVCNLNIQNAEDLLESFKVVMKQLDGEDSIIEKHYQRDTKIFFKFVVSTSTNDRVVVIQLISSETDSAKIIVPLKPVFQSFLRRLKYFVENYDEICLNVFNQTFNNEAMQIIKQLPSLIKGISSQIVSQIPDADFSPDSCAPDLDEDQVKRTEGDINDLDKFMGENMENISIPEIDDGKIDETAPIVEIESPFVEKVLKGDLYNLENKIMSFAVSNNPVFDLKEDLEEILGFKLLEDIPKDAVKSITYISLFLKEYYSKNYTINGNALPSSTLPIKFVGKMTNETLELAKDLGVIIAYMRTVSRRLEMKSDDAYENKSMLFLYLRTILDVFCFGYLEFMNRNELVSAFKNRYLYFDSIGMFDKYKKLLNDYNCSKITDGDIIGFAQEMLEKVVGISSTIEDLHEKLYESGDLKLPAKNSYSLEQIINEFIPLEVKENLGVDLKNKDVIEKIKEQHTISDEILKLFTGKQKVQKSQKMKKITPLYRWIDKFKQDIPEKYREDVLKHISELEYNNFDFSNCEWPLDEFDENIIKGLYIWDPKSDDQMKSNFEYFASMVEDEAMTKDGILLSTKVENSEGWNALANLV